jgi:hypothetical protein
MWDGLRLAKIRDKRIISTTVRDFMLAPIGNETLKYLAITIAGGAATSYVEDFKRPRYHDLIPNSSRGTSLTDVMSTNNMGKLRVGEIGRYKSRALPVDTANSGLEWQVVIVPLETRRPHFSYDYLYNVRPTLHYYDGSVWQTTYMAASAGLPNTYRTTLTAVPVFVAIELYRDDYAGMIIFG